MVPAIFMEIDGEIGFFPDFPADLKAVRIRKHHIQNRQVQIRMCDTVQGFRTRVTLINRTAIAYEIQLNDISQFFFIVYY